MTTTVHIWTDGGCYPNPGMGGWAAILKFGDTERVIVGKEFQSTNNRMELMAALMALKALKRPCEVILHADSQYVGRGLTEFLAKWRVNGWRNSQRKTIENIELWQKIDPLTRKHSITFEHVSGHSGVEMNERCDRLASQAIFATAAELELLMQ